MTYWALWKRWFGASRLLLLACCVGLFVFCWIRVWVITQLETSRLEVILQQVWDKYDRFAPVPLSQILTYHGRVALAFNEPLIILFVGVWAIARGSETVSGHIHSGVMEMLLSQPISRSKVMSSQTTITTIGLALLAVCVWLGVAAGIETLQVKEERTPSITIPGLKLDIPLPMRETEHVKVPMSAKTNPRYFIYPTINLFCVGLFIAGFTTLASSLDRYRWRTIGIIIGLVAVQMVMCLVSLASESFAWMKYLTFYSAYQPEVIVSIAVHSPQEIWSLVQRDKAGTIMGPGPLGYDLILLIPGILSLLASRIIFCRRDLPAPL
jgi:ABC-2 type transport system permease protein